MKKSQDGAEALPRLKEGSTTPHDGARLLLAGIVVAAVTASLAAEITTSEQDVDVKAGAGTVRQHRLILENEFLRVAVAPNPGGTVVEFVNKKTGTDFVAGADKFARGAAGFGWTDFESFEDLDLAGKRFLNFPYEASFRTGCLRTNPARRSPKNGIDLHWNTPRNWTEDPS